MCRSGRYVAAAALLLMSALIGVCCLCNAVPVLAASGQQAQAVFNSGRVRPAEDPVVTAHGKALYEINCQACHGKDLRGGDMGGPNLLRSQVVLADQHGERITPVIQGARMAQGMPNIGLNDADAGAVAGYIRSIIANIGGAGAPPGEKKALNVIVGDAARGQAYFSAHCSNCHSVLGDLRGIATSYPSPEELQARWISGGGGNRKATSKPTAEVSVRSGSTISGEVIHVDDFLVSIRLADGTSRSFLRKGEMPRVVMHDPLQAHRDNLARYTDSDIHDVTAYLATLK